MAYILSNIIIKKTRRMNSLNFHFVDNFFRKNAIIPNICVNTHTHTHTHTQPHLLPI